MNVQRLQTVIIVILLLGSFGFGAALYVKNNDMTEIHNSIGALSDEVRQNARNRDGGSSSPPDEADIASARASLRTCGQAQEHPADEALLWLETGKKFAALVDDGYELIDACVDDSESPRILFLATKHLPSFAGDDAFGILSEADPKAATIATSRDTLNLVNEALPSTCVITGSGAVPASQFLVRCENADAATSDGFVLDFAQREITQAYRCTTGQNAACTKQDHGAYDANKDSFDDDALRNMP